MIPLGEFEQVAKTLGETLEAVQGGQTVGPCEDDLAGLQAIIHAWPRLSNDVKASILAMVRAVGE